MKKRIFQIAICFAIITFLASCAQKKRCPAYGYHQTSVEYTE